MAKLSTLKASTAQHILVFGPPKSGKSLLAGLLSEHYNVVWVDCENGHDVLFQLPESWQERIELVNLPDTRSYPIAIETCLKLVKGKVNICELHGKVSCMLCKRAEAPTLDIDLPSLGHDSLVVFDSMTQLSNSAISHITKGKQDDYKLDYDDWGNLGKLLDIFLSHLQQANYHAIVISHEIEAETEGKKKTLVPVGGTRNFSRNMAKYFDHVVYAERKNKRHVFSSSTCYATNVLTGSRSNIALETIGEKGASTLLPFFKPELYPKVEPTFVFTREKSPDSIVRTTVSTSPSTKPIAGGVQANSILARLKAKK